MENRLGRDHPYIIAEIHPQHGGDLRTVEAMILQCKSAGADAIKLQLYDSMALEGDRLREYVQLSRGELESIVRYAEQTRIDVFASVFDVERVDWCEALDIPYYKIASRSVDDRALCEKMLATGKTTFISLGMYDWSKGMPYDGGNAQYLYCVSKYPATLEDIRMPVFGPDGPGFSGYSDHTVGISACLYAVGRGARVLEKHYTMNRAALCNTERAHVCSLDWNELSQLRAMTDDMLRLRRNANAE